MPGPSPFPSPYDYERDRPHGAHHPGPHTSPGPHGSHGSHSPHGSHGSPGQHGSHGSHGPHGQHGSHGHPSPAGVEPAPTAPSGSVADLVRWAAFSCLLVPVVLLVYGAPPGGTALAAGGLAAVTIACRLLLRRSERIATRDLAEELQAGTHRGRHSRTGSGAHRGGRKADA